MANYLISGLPTAGKTTVQLELDKLGYTTIDSNEAWDQHAERIGGIVIDMTQPLSDLGYEIHSLNYLFFQNDMYS